jgi:hypothetical protein
VQSTELVEKFPITYMNLYLLWRQKIGINNIPYEKDISVFAWKVKHDNFNRTENMVLNNDVCQKFSESKIVNNCRCIN